jgi:hypothetical protein
MTVTKVDFKRELSRLYRPGRHPALVDVPELAFLMIDGHGDPNVSVDYKQAIEALYSVSYALKFAIKRAPGGVDYAVMPLEGLWWSEDSADFLPSAESDWLWTAMIMQADEVSAEMVDDAIDTARRKRTLPAADKLRLARFHEGMAAQLMHVGPYAEEPPTIERLHAFISAEGYVLQGKHHEIYLGDPRRSAPEKLRTVIRQPVARG